MTVESHKMRLLARLADHARDRPRAAAVRTSHPTIGTERVLGYLELHESVERLARRLSAEAGVVALSAPSSAEFVVAYLGALRAGRVIHPIPQHSCASEIREFVRVTEARTLIGDASALECAEAGVERISMSGLIDASHGEPGVRATGEPGLLLPSSGTTGLPKIAVRSAASLDAVAENVALAAGLMPSDVVLAGVPMSHSYGMENGLLGPIWAGSTIHIAEREGHADVAEVLGVLSRRGITVFPGVPFMVDMLAKLAASGGVETDLRLVYTAGSPLPTGVMDLFRERFGLEVGQLYGATEVGSVTFSGPGEGSDASNVGRPLPGVSIRILDAAGAACEPGEEGQVAIRATSMLSHYLGGDRRDPAFSDGYFLTGDLGRLNVDGSLCITGRIKLLIDVGGFKVNPLEVERTLSQHPDVGEVVVLPVRVTDTVSRLRALILPRAGGAGPVVVENVRQFAKERLAPHKVPRMIEVVESLPKSATGKVLRRQLGAMA